MATAVPARATGATAARPSSASLLRGLPREIVHKLNKTKQTRGAQPYERVPYQNRVNRSGIAIVPYAFRDRLHPDGFENGYRTLVRPAEYFHTAGVPRGDFDPAVRIGQNAFVYYDNRADWRTYPPPSEWTPCEQRDGNGHYLARVPATTANDPREAEEIVRGAPQGIRFFEYASSADVALTVAQLAWLAWHTMGIDIIRTDSANGVPGALAEYVRDHRLLDLDRLEASGAIVRSAETGQVATVCPLCREPLNASGLMTRLEQAEGREVVDLTVTEVNLFHLQDLRPGEYNHRPYLVAWGHHHCNTVARDAGVTATLGWMVSVLERHGHRVIRPASTTAPPPLPSPAPDSSGGR